jgi:hypothetical protein
MSLRKLKDSSWVKMVFPISPVGDQQSACPSTCLVGGVLSP